MRKCINAEEESQVVEEVCDVRVVRVRKESGRSGSSYTSSSSYCNSRSRNRNSNTDGGGGGGGGSCSLQWKK